MSVGAIRLPRNRSLLLVHLHRRCRGGGLLDSHGGRLLHLPDDQVLGGAGAGIPGRLLERLVRIPEVLLGALRSQHEVFMNCRCRCRSGCWIVGEGVSIFVKHIFLLSSS